MEWVYALAVAGCFAMVACALLNSNDATARQHDRLMAEDRLMSPPASAERGIPLSEVNRLIDQAVANTARERRQHEERLVARASAIAYDKGYHDSANGLPNDPHNGSGIVTTERRYPRDISG